MVPRPRIRNACRLSRVYRFSLFRFRSPLLTESRLLSLPEGTEMFHFPSFPPHALCVQAWVTGHDSSRVSPFGNPRITARLTAPRGLSQPPTSFFGSWYLGIHRAPLLTWPQRCSRPLCSSQGTGGSPTPDHRVHVSRPKPASEPFDGGRSLSTPQTFQEGAERGPEVSKLPKEPARSLRTQQRASALTTRSAVPLHPRAVVLADVPSCA